MTTFSKKYFNNTTQAWEPLYSTEGMSAYKIAKLEGYEGTEEEYNQALYMIGTLLGTIDEVPTEGSSNLVLSGGVFESIKVVNELVKTLPTIEDVNDLIKGSIVDNLTSEDATKSLSANQGKILKSLIDAIKEFSIVVLQDDEELPEIGESHTIYLKKKTDAQNDVYSEYLYIDNKWEIVGTTDVDLSNYYTKDQVYNKEEVDNIKNTIESNIPNVEVSIGGQGNVITSLNVDLENAHKIIGNKELEVYSKQEIDNKFSDPLLGNVIASTNFTTEGRVIVSAGNDKSVKDSGVLLENLALKSYVDEKEITWDKITNPPSTYTPSEHTHVVSDITDFPEIPSLDGYATEEWVNSQGFKTTDTNTWRPIKSGSTTLNDSTTPLTINAGDGIDLAFEDGTLTITNTSSGSGSGYVLPTASSSTKGGIKLGYVENSENIPLKVSNETAFVTITPNSINAALGYTPANTEDIPSIPSTLPNPQILNITTNGSKNSYDGSAEVNINLDNIYSIKTGNTSTPGAPGICIKTESTTYNISSVSVTEDNPNSVLIVPADSVVNITDSKCKKIDGIETITGTSDQYKCYAFMYISSSLVLVNCALYK